MRFIDTDVLMSGCSADMRRRLCGGVALATTAASLLGGSPAMAQHAAGQAATTSPATPPAGGSPKLPPATMKQLSSILSDHYTWSATRKKVQSQLVYAARMAAGLPCAPGVPTLHTGVVTNSDGTVNVVIRATSVNSALLAAITAAGGTVTNSYPRTCGIYARVPLQNMELIAARSDVWGIKVPAKPRVEGHGVRHTALAPYNKDRWAQPASKSVNIPSVIAGPLSPFAGSDLSSSLIPSLLGAKAPRVDEAYTTQGVAAITSTYGLTGAGIKVGVMSTSTGTSQQPGTEGEDCAVAAQNVGALPTGTGLTIVEDPGGTTAEGCAMLEDVYALAPGAALYFASAVVNEDDFANNIINLRETYGCNIICDDVGYSDEPAFSDGLLAQAVNTAVNDGAIYFSAAGNSGHLATDDTPLAYEGDFVNTGEYISYTGTDDLGATVTIIGYICGFGTDDHNDYLDPDGDEVSLEWADPYYNPTDSYEIFTTDPFGGLLDAEFGVGYEPYATALAEGGPEGSGNTGSVYVVLVSGNAVALHLNDNNDANFGGTDSPAFLHVTDGAIVGHAAAVEAFGVAAAPAHAAFTDGYHSGPYPGLFTTNSPAENFSDDGPRQIFYTVNSAGIGSPVVAPATGGDVTEITPGELTFASGGGTSVAKPDFMAGDGTATVDPTQELANEGLNPFYGTSCATPHAVAMAALFEQYNYSSGGLTVTGSKVGLSEARYAFQGNPIHVKTPAWDNVKGYGFINVPSSITWVQNFLTSAPTATVNSTTAYVHWTTDLPSSSVVYYGQGTASLNLTASATGYVTNHTVYMPSGFNASIPHYYKIQSITPNGAVAYTDTTARVLNTAVSASSGPADIILSNLQLTRTTYKGTAVIQATATFTDAGSGAATDAILDQALLGGNSPVTGTVSTTSYATIGPIAASKTGTITLYFPVLGSGSVASFSYAGAADTAFDYSFSGAVKVVIP